MNKTAMTLTPSPELIPLSIAAQTEIKGGGRSSCEEKRRPIRKPK